MLKTLFDYLKTFPVLKDLLKFFVHEKNFREKMIDFRTNLQKDRGFTKEQLLAMFRQLVADYKQHYDSNKGNWQFVNASPLLFFGMDMDEKDNIQDYQPFFQILKELAIDFNQTTIREEEEYSGVGNNILLWAVANANTLSAYHFLIFATENEVDFDFDCQDSLLKNTALILAVAKGYREKNGKNKNLPFSNLELIKQLIKHINPNIKNFYGISALDLAVARRDIDMINIILDCDLISVEVIKKTCDILLDPYNEGQDFLFTKSVNIVKSSLGLKPDCEHHELCSVSTPIDKELFTSEKTDEIMKKLTDKISELTSIDQVGLRPLEAQNLARLRGSSNNFMAFN